MDHVNAAITLKNVRKLDARWLEIAYTNASIFVQIFTRFISPYKTFRNHPQLSHCKVQPYQPPLWNCMHNSLHTATHCAICSGVRRCGGTHLCDTRRICKSPCKITNALPTEMFKCCASSQTLIFWTSCTLTAVVFCKTLLQAILDYPSHGSSTILSWPLWDALYLW